jgi:hypothetical protein
MADVGTMRNLWCERTRERSGTARAHEVASRVDAAARTPPALRRVP